MSRFRNTIVAGLALTGAFGIAAAGVAEAKSVSLIPASCSNGTATHIVYLASGSKATLGFGSNSVASLGTWHIVISDNGLPLLDRTLVASVPAWSLSTQRTLAKGTHFIEIVADNQSTGETCTYSLTNKV
ncbi:MAG: hypothetical protein ABMA25_13910 [Ilumatobacteraceae bacterium]